jgi:probable HAF family extracellular repeat protein
LLAAVPLSALAAPTLADPLFTLTTLPKGFAGLGINYSGQVVGNFDNAATIWSKTDFVSLNHSIPDSRAYAISHRGAMVGSVTGDLFIDSYGAIRSIPSPPHAVRLATNYAWPNAMNDADQIAGWSIGPDSNRGFLYSGGDYQTIGTFSGEGDSYAQGMNNRGQVVGRAATGRAGSAEHAFLYDGGGLLALGTLPGAASSQAFDMNERDQIVGDSGGRPFLYADGRMSDIGDPRDETAAARAINNAGWVVGAGDYADEVGIQSHAFLYGNGRNLDLGTRLVGAGGWHLVAAQDINDSGQILAFGCKDGEGCGSVLLDPVSPIPEPSHIAMLASGLLLLIGARRGISAGAPLASPVS